MLATAARRSSSALPPLRLAIVGSGPSGFYSAARVLAAFKNQGSHGDIKVDMYERLPIPNGLVRWGVAPDHPDVKNVERKFAEVAADPRFSFFGNVNIVSSIAVKVSQKGYNYPHAVRVPIAHLQQHYTHLLLSYGCSQSKPLGIPGSQSGELLNVHSALDFVNWYNGHPAAHDDQLLAREPWRRIDLMGLEQISVIGAGNVALDVARIVLRTSTSSLLDPAAPLPPSSISSAALQARKDLETSDVPEPVLQQLSEARITSVDINARRGPAQVAFTNKELREMMALPGVGFHNVDKDLIKRAEDDVQSKEEEEARVAAKDTTGGHDARERAAKSAGRARVKKRLLSLLAKGSKTKQSQADKMWSLNFFRAPVAFVGSSSTSSSPPPSTSSPLQPPKLEKIKWTSTSLAQGGVEMLSTSGTDTPLSVWGNEPSNQAQDPQSSQNGGVATLPSGSDRPTSRVPNSVFETTADLVVSSVGYKGEALAGASNELRDGDHGLREGLPTSSAPIPWDPAKGIVPNRLGRVVASPNGSIVSTTVKDRASRQYSPYSSPPHVVAVRCVRNANLSDRSRRANPCLTQIPGLYVSGWLSRGPIGVIASTMYDAYCVADLILEDHRQGLRQSQDVTDAVGRFAVSDALRDLEPYRQEKKIVGWQDWRRLDEYEKEEGRKLGKQREKVLSIPEMLSIMS